jgi:transcription elongation factor Elf1
MKIKKKTYLAKKDYQAVMECENCGHNQLQSGFDDYYYDTQIIPQVKCKMCKKSTSEIENKGEIYVRENK